MKHSTKPGVPTFARIRIGLAAHGRFWKRLAAAVVAALALSVACDDPTGVTPPDELASSAPIVSEPLAVGLAGSSAQAHRGQALSSDLVARRSADRLVYVSLPGGAYPAGVTATIGNTAGGTTVVQTMRGGGFDPVALPAGVGDTIVIRVQNGAGATTEVLLLKVPRRRPPAVVRTIPPKGKRDVPLNSRFIVVFSEPLDPASVTSTSIALLRGGASVAGALRLFPGGLVAELTPSVPLDRRTTYELTVSEGIVDLEGEALDASASVAFTTGTTTAAPVTAVEVSPPSATLDVGDVLGDSVQLTATVRGAAGVLTDREVIWSTNDPAVALVSSTGLVKALAPGLVTITATSEGKEGSSQITVAPMPVARVDVAQSNPTVDVGETVYLFAVARDRHGRPLTRRPIAWESGDVEIATVDQRGLVTGVAAGAVTITATSEGVSGTATVAVGAPLMLDRVDIDPPAKAVPVGGSTQLSARAYRCDAGLGSCSEVTGQPVTWASTDDGVAAVDQTGRVTAMSAGLVVITAVVDGIEGSAPMTVLPTAPITLASVSAGYYFTCGLTSSGEAHCWGHNVYGALGTGAHTGLGELDPAAVAPVAVTGGHAFASLSAGGWHACGLTTGGVAYCWGLALQNQLGQSGSPGTQMCEYDGQQDSGSDPCAPAPIRVSGETSFRALYAGGLHTCALTASGKAYCWGSDRYGQLGDGGGVTSHGLPPTPVAGELTFANLSAGFRHVCGVTTEGKAYCWGYNYHGQLGDGTTSNRDIPVAVAGDLTFASVTAGIYHSCGLTTDGSVHCWGENYYGQLGDGTRSNRETPVAVAGGGSFASVKVGEWHSCALTTSGAAYCWGANWSGTLGDGSGSSQSTPVAVAGGHVFESIAIGDIHACGLTTSQVAYCWGWNQSGQLGDGSATDRRTPVRVVGQR